MTGQFDPTGECLETLNSRDWICSYSGGKDSTSLVTWVEWLRREKKVRVKNPRLVLSDTGVEYPLLRDVADRMMKLLSSSGWECAVVRPPVSGKLYNQIFGRGLQPIHPGIKKYRWCTRSTKSDPMDKFVETLGPEVLRLSGVRWGESAKRDGKLAFAGCAAGGECGLPVPGENAAASGLYCPIVNWRACWVVDWLMGLVDRNIASAMTDVFALTKELAEVYDLEAGRVGFGFAPPEVTSLRFGCVGCPAIGRDKVIDRAVADHPKWKHLRRLYYIWDRMRLPHNRLSKKKGNKVVFGPVKMSVRKEMFGELLDIQEKSGVILVDEADVAFIRKCWEDKVYPRGWSAGHDG